MKKYKIKLKALTPVHIGTGEDYEPVNFVIDDGYLYEFDEMAFFNSLDEKMKKRFLTAVEKRSDESFFEIHRLIKENKHIAKKVAFKKTQVSKAVEEEYEKIGKPVNFEGKHKNRKVFKDFNIHKTLRFSNTPYQVYIPGSSIKGALLTAFGEYVYKKDKNLFFTIFKNCMPSTKNIFKYVKVSDTTPLKTYSVIGYAVNKERFEDNDTGGPDQQLEVIYSNEKQHSEFEFELVLQENVCKKDYKLTIDELKKACNEHYRPIFEQMMDGYSIFNGKETDDFTNEYFSNSFWEKYKRLKLKKNEFLLRVGKFSQARAVTIEGVRRIRVKESGGGPKRKPLKWKTLDQETTSWLFGLNKKSGLMPFGWVLCEIIEENDEIKTDFFKKKTLNRETNTENNEDDEKKLSLKKLLFEYEKEISENKEDEFKFDYSISFNTVEYFLKEKSALKELFIDLPGPILKTVAFNNFKGFGEKPQIFEVKPILLVYAPNSVGKSSFLHALIFLKYFINHHLEGKVDLIKTNEFGDELDLGGFETFVHRHDLSKSIKYELEIENAVQILLMINGLNEKGIKRNFFLINLIRNTDSFEKDLRELYEIIAEEYEYVKNTFDDCMKTLDNKIRDARDYEEEAYLILKKIFLEMINSSYKEKKDIHLNLEKLREKLDGCVQFKEYYEKNINLTVTFEIFRDGHSAKYEFENGICLDDGEKEKIKIIDRFLMKDVVYLGPLRFYPDRDHVFNDEKNFDKFDSVNLWKLLTKRNTLRQEINEWLTDKDKLKSSYEIRVLDNKIRFYDKRTQTLVSNKDIGLGVSQIMPILVSTNFLRKKWIFIEQPELHLHPAVQAELGDEIIKGKKWGNFYLIETHSEYLLLRIMKRIRHYFEKKEERDAKFDLTNKDVGVLYIDECEGEIYLKELRLSQDGSLLDRWPGGFFEEGFKERFF